MRFKKSKIYLSIIPVATLGFGIGILTSVMGVGGGFIMVPAMIYLLRIPTNVVVGTSLFQIVFVSAYTVDRPGDRQLYRRYRAGLRADDRRRDRRAIRRARRPEAARRAVAGASGAPGSCRRHPSCDRAASFRRRKSIRSFPRGSASDADRLTHSVCSVSSFAAAACRAGGTDGLHRKARYRHLDRRNLDHLRFPRCGPDDLRRHRRLRCRPSGAGQVQHRRGARRAEGKHARCARRSASSASGSTPIR